MSGRRLAGALVAAAASVLALPPHDAAPLAWVALVPLFLALHGASRRATVGLAVLYAVGLIVGDVEPWLGPAAAAYFEVGLGRALAVTAPSLAAVAVVHGLALGVLLCARPRRSGPFDVLVSAAAWAMWDALRTRAFPYYPGGVVALSQHGTTSVLQLASLTGIAGVSFLLVACNAGLATGILARDRRGVAAAVMGVGLPLAVAALGGSRVRPEPPAGPVVTAVDVRAGSAAEGTLERYLAASQGEGGTGLLVWPESALPGDPTRDPALLAALRAFTAARRVPLLAGGLGSVLRADRRGFAEFNAAYLVMPDGRVDGYRKRLLVPFAEQWPAVLGAPPASLGPVEPGRESTIFHLDPATLFGVLICFEVTAPGGALALARGGARFLVNLSNDAWFAAAPHLAWAAVRAVETGVPLLRAANAGVSVAFDRFGRPVPVRPDGPLRAVFEVPRAEPTVYTRRGEVFLLGCGMLVLVAALGRLRAA